MRWFMPRARRLPGIALLLAGVAFPVDAQTRGRDGTWFELQMGTGTGAVRNACGGCTTVTTAYGSASNIRVGRSVTPDVMVGLEIFAMHSATSSLALGLEELDAENAMISPIVMVYVGDDGFYVKGGAGLSRGTFTVIPEGQAPVTTTREGSGLTVGLGYDIDLAGGFGMSLNLGTYIMAIGDVRVDDLLVDDVIATVYEAGISVALW